jgi:hypothetical protein
MQPGLAPLLHDAAVLHTFADFIEQYCSEQERSQRYIDASGEFFRYAKNLASGIKIKVSADVQRAARFPKRKRAVNFRRNIFTFKGYLRVLHTLIKPATDAHTLSIPAPLINLACEHLQRIEGMDGSKVVVLLTPELMYFQRPHTEVKVEAARVQKLIPKAVFPEKLGFIEIPYSQGPNFSPNLAIYHEIGHFVYEEISTQLSPVAEFSSLENTTDNLLRRFASHPKEHRLAEQILGSWTQEIFCDLLALRLLGPAFSFALVEILAMLNLLSERPTRTFTQLHPAPACRLSEHLRFLQLDSRWWTAISYVRSAQKTLLEDLAKIPRTDYMVYPDDAPKRLISPFLDSVVPAIRQLVARLIPQVASAVQRFEDERRLIQECLSVGVVPHTNPSTPLDPVSIINSAFCFYVTELPNTVRNFEGRGKENDVEIRSKWARKLEAWTLKAIEDSQIRAQFERRYSGGSLTE